MFVKNDSSHKPTRVTVLISMYNVIDIYITTAYRANVEVHARLVENFIIGTYKRLTVGLYYTRSVIMVWREHFYLQKCRKTFAKQRDEKNGTLLWELSSEMEKVIFVAFYRHVYYVVFCLLAKTFCQFHVTRSDLETSDVL